ncbi:MAG: NUDIX hydrolase [Gemmatimonadales bacterium]|nr:NUDIX hydrolase [Gemmatimonadales bacterium]
MALELNDQVVDTPPRDAASVLLLRDAANGVGVEIFMVRRHQRSDVLGGAYVFPGGKVDEADSAVVREAALMEQLYERLGEPALGREMAAAMFAAAARETVEECHVTVGVADLVPFTRWITPRTPSLQRKRFDTRFFAAPLPAGAQATHDNHEAVDSVWLAPRLGLERYWAGEIDLAPPQIMSLAQLSRYRNLADALADVARRPPPLIEPASMKIEDTRAVAYPGDPAHSLRDKVMPGPTRLVFRNKRFEPEGGFAAFFED